MAHHAGGGALMLAGRAGDLDRLRSALGRLAAGHGGVVLIEGEAGVGKTTLAEVVLAEARVGGAVTAIGRAYEQGAAPPFAPWPDLLAALAASAALDEGRLPPPFGAGPAAQTSYQLLQAVATSMRIGAGRRAIAVLLDDVQWAEQEALDLLDLVSRRLDDVPLLVLVTFRSEDARAGQPLHSLLARLQRNRMVVATALGPLGAQEVGWLAEARLGPCSAELTAYLLQRTEGNPLFVTLLLDDLLHQGRLRRGSDGRWQPPADALSPPSLLRVIVEQQVARLGGEVVAFLDVAAVAGMEWDLATIEAVLAWPEEVVLQALDDVVAAGIVQTVSGDAERYRFRHSLVRDVLYERQLGRRRRHVHARIGAALVASADPPSGALAPALTYHAAAAEDWSRLARWAVVAGDQARERLANHTAASFYEQALTASDRLTATDQPVAPALVAERLGQTLLLLSRHHAAEAAFTRMATAARAAGDEEMETRALCWQSWSARRGYRLSAARSLATLALTRARSATHVGLLALAHWNMGHLEKIEGDPPVAMDHLTKAERTARAAGATDVLGWSLQSLAQLAVWRGDYALAETQAAEALMLARAAGDPLNVGGAAWVLGTAQGEQGLAGAALRTLHDGLALVVESGERHYEARLLNTVGWVHAGVGDFVTARQWDEASLTAARRDGGDAVSEAERYALLNLAADALGLGDALAAAAHLATVARRLDDSDYARLRYLNRYQLLCAELALARGDGLAALGHADDAARLAHHKGVRKNLARGRLLSGQALLLLERPREAADRLRDAVALADALAHGALRWQARLWLGRAEAAHNQPRAAAATLAAALSQVDAIAAALPTTAMQAAFLAWEPVRALRAAGTAPPAIAATAAGLSAREVDVLRLVAQGATNQAIADALSISIKTVNTHMTSIFNKTGCANRAAATHFAVRHGLA